MTAKLCAQFGKALHAIQIKDPYVAGTMGSHCSKGTEQNKWLKTTKLLNIIAATHIQLLKW